MFGDENVHVRGVAKIRFGDTNGDFMFANMATLVGVVRRLLKSATALIGLHRAMDEFCSHAMKPLSQSGVFLPDRAAAPAGCQ